MQLLKQMISEPPTLQQMLHRHIAYEEVGRDAWKLHGSSLTDQQLEFCGREVALRWEVQYKAPNERIHTSRAVTFKWGRMVESQVAEWFAEMGSIVGDWQCLHRPCGETYLWCARPAKCHCGGVLFRHIEQRVTSPYSGASCGIDLLVRRTGAQKLRAVEIKSIKGEEHKKLLGPLGEHRLRTKLYLRTIAEAAKDSPDPMVRERWSEVDTEHATVIYVSKDGWGGKCDQSDWEVKDGGFSPFVEFEIDRQDSTSDVVVERARKAKLFMEGQGPRPQRLCAVEAHPRSQQCPMRGHCWKLKE